MERPERFRVQHRLAEPVLPPQAPPLARERGRTKPKYSRWMITVNPNIRMPVWNQMTFDTFKGRFLQWMGCVFPENTFDPKWSDVLKIAPFGVERGDTDQDIPALITDVNSVTGVELGRIQRRVHMHALIEIEHWSWLHINTERIREIINECAQEIPMPGQIHHGRSQRIYVNIKYVGSARPVQNYVYKQSWATQGGELFENAPANPTREDWEKIEKMSEKQRISHDWVMGAQGPREKPKKTLEDDFSNLSL